MVSVLGAEGVDGTVEEAAEPKGDGDGEERFKEEMLATGSGDGGSIERSHYLR